MTILRADHEAKEVNFANTEDSSYLGNYHILGHESVSIGYKHVSMIKCA